MEFKTEKVNAYIEKAVPFAQPILKKIRTHMHKAHPEITEELKRSTPAFMHEGMVAFKAYVRFGASANTWNGSPKPPAKKRIATALEWMAEREGEGLEV